MSSGSFDCTFRSRRRRRFWQSAIRTFVRNFRPYFRSRLSFVPLGARKNDYAKRETHTRGIYVDNSSKTNGKRHTDEFLRAHIHTLSMYIDLIN